MPTLPVRVLANAMVRPSGDHAGSRSKPSPRVRCFYPTPVGVHDIDLRAPLERDLPPVRRPGRSPFVILGPRQSPLTASVSIHHVDRQVPSNAICFPSGDHAGDPSLSEFLVKLRWFPSIGVHDEYLARAAEVAAIGPSAFKRDLAAVRRPNRRPIQSRVIGRPLGVAVLVCDDDFPRAGKALKRENPL